MTSVADEIARALKGLFYQYYDECEFYVVECDTKVVRGPYKIGDDWRNFGVETKGGTCLDPGTKSLNKIGPFDVFIFATDGEMFCELEERPRASTVICLYPENYSSLKKAFPKLFRNAIEIVVKKEKVFRVI